MITFYSKDGKHITQSIYESKINMSVSDLIKVEFCKVDEAEESKFAFFIVGRELVSKEYMFCGDEARTIAANWG